MCHTYALSTYIFCPKFWRRDIDKRNCLTRVSIHGCEESQSLVSVASATFRASRIAKQAHVHPSLLTDSVSRLIHRPASTHLRDSDSYATTPPPTPPHVGRPTPVVVDTDTYCGRHSRIHHSSAGDHVEIVGAVNIARVSICTLVLQLEGLTRALWQASGI